MSTRRIAHLVALAAIFSVAESTRAQSLVLHLDGARDPAASGDALTPHLSGTKLPAIALGNVTSPDVDSTFVIQDSAIRRPAEGGEDPGSSLVYRLAQPGVGSFARSSDGTSRLELSASVSLPGPDGRSIAVYDVRLTGDVPTGPSFTSASFPVLVEGWRERIGSNGERTGELEPAFHGVLPGRLSEE
ncbi:MAG: hypothetical protein WEF50_10185 [Myxococcota bacterium]